MRNTLAVASKNGVVQFWNVSSRQPVGDPFPSGQTMSTAAWSADGRVLAAGGADGALWLWRLPGRRPQRLVGPPGAVGELAFSRDGRTLAAGATDTNDPASPSGTVRLYDVASGKRIDDLPVGWEVEGARVRPGRAHARHGALRLRSRGGRARRAPSLESWPRKKLGPLGQAAQERRRVRGAWPSRRAGARCAVARSDGTVQLVATRDWKPAGPPLRGLRGERHRLRQGRPHASPVQPEDAVRVWTSAHRRSFGRAIGNSGEATNRAVGFSADGRTAVAVDDAGVMRRR